MNETEIRQRLVDALEADLVGPFVPDSHPQGGQEILPIAPSRWYLTGFLAPQGSRKPDADDQDSTNEEIAAGSETQAEDAGETDPEPKIVAASNAVMSRSTSASDALCLVLDRAQDHTIARYPRSLGEPTSAPEPESARGPPFWRSRILRRATFGGEAA